MRVPPFAAAILLVAAGFAAPGLTSALPEPADGQVGMEQEEFDTDQVEISVGDTLTFVNNSHFLHVLAPGERARIEEQNGTPRLEGDLNTYVSEAGNVYTTARWNTPGEFYLTCTLHPEMTVEVVVLPR